MQQASEQDNGSGQDAISRQINDGAAKAGKHYSYDDAHDPQRPADLWFQQAPEGLVLFIVFYSQACRWSRCLGCNLPMKMSSQHIPFGSLMAQIDYVLDRPDVVQRHKEIRKVIVSNNGSVLDEKTFSSTALIYLMAKLNLHLPNMSVLTLETRPEYTDPEELEFLARALAEGDTPTSLEFAIGFEAFDDHIRNDIFDKGLKLEGFERFAKLLSPYGYRLKCYFMQKPVPGMTDEEAVKDIQAAIDYLAAIGKKYDLSINMHLNPTYAATGTPLADSFGRGEFVPPKLADVARAAAHGSGKGLSIFVGLSDEGLAVEGGSFRRAGDEELAGVLEEFNRTQNFSLLKDYV